MFNNRFNSSKNDPLVEAVKQAQADGDMRRQAVAAVNEQFGVFSRNAVVREDLAAYDAAIEEAYKCMKEGKPVLAKKDYDKDGKVESPKDEVWGSRFRAAKAAGKMEEGSAVSGEDPGMAVAKKAGAAQQSQTPSSTPTRTGNAAGSTISNARGAAGMNEEEQIDEISKELAGRYIKKADYKRSDSSFQSGKVYGKELATKRRTKQDVEDSRKHNRDSFKREKGINMAVNKLTGRAKVQANEETQIDEATRKHFAAHAADISKISDQGERNKAASSAASTYARLNPRFDHAKFHAAAGSTAHQEPKKMEEAAYSAKAAREGKDIGKPGKMFAKIAAKAGEKYGSEERGKKVAGAILKKIRAKHMKEGLTVEPVNPVKNPNSSPNPTSSDISNPSQETKSRARMGATPAVQEVTQSMNESVQIGVNKYRII